MEWKFIFSKDDVTTKQSSYPRLRGNWSDKKFWLFSVWFVEHKCISHKCNFSNQAKAVKHFCSFANFNGLNFDKFLNKCLLLIAFLFMNLISPNILNKNYACTCINNKIKTKIRCNQHSQLQYLHNDITIITISAYTFKIGLLEKRSTVGDSCNCWVTYCKLIYFAPSTSQFCPTSKSGVFLLVMESNGA